MSDAILHHVSIVCTDLERSVNFYRELLGLARLERPNFATPGAWLACGPALQLHVIHYPQGTFRSGGIDINDAHFSFRTDDFSGVLARLQAAGFSAGAAEDDPKRLVVFDQTRAGFPQLYLLDPDRNIVEVNGAPDRQPPAFSG